MTEVPKILGFILNINIFIILTHGQETAGNSVAQGLVKCYNGTTFLEQTNRFPNTIEVLIALIRKLEEANFSVGARELSAQILHRYRQDGIIRSVKKKSVNPEFGIPYSPKSWDAFKNIVILKNLIPNNAQINNSTFNDQECCSLHFMISKAIDLKTRGDEGIGKCILREKRSEQFGVDLIVHSLCPIELGVISTKWGAVSAGTLLSGISSGLNEQLVPTEQVTKNSTQLLDSRYGSTISGDLAEAALYDRADVTSIGGEGSFNNTLMPKWYFVNKNSHLRVTDAEIRGGLDGLFLAKNINNIRKKYNNIKLSQILDMYYSQKGVLDEKLKACNRKLYRNLYTTTEELVNHTTAFLTLLDKVATLDATIQASKYPELANSAVDKFENYLRNNLNDPPCPSNSSDFRRASANLVIFIDTNFFFKDIQSVLSYILENLDVNNFGTKYTLINADDGLTVIPRTTTILDYYELYNETVHNNLSRGIDYVKVLETIDNVAGRDLSNSTNYGGYSTIFLIVSGRPPNEVEQNFAARKTIDLRLKFPDLKILSLGIGENNNYRDFVTNTETDVVIVSVNIDSLPSESLLKERIDNLVNRIKTVPRSITNPACESRQNSTNFITKQINRGQYVEPQSINYYRISPNYFAKHADNAAVKIISESAFGSIKACISRSESFSSENTNCGDFKFDLSNACDGATVESCDPIYISVEGLTSTVNCNDDLCRFPDDIKYSITLENVECASGNEINSVNEFILITLIIVSSRLSNIL